MVVKPLLYCTRKCGCEGGLASCFLQPPRNGSTDQVPVLEHETFSRTVPGAPRTQHLVHVQGVPRTVLEKASCSRTGT